MRPTYLSIVIRMVAAAPSSAVYLRSLGCQTQSQANPIAAQYPTLTTGTINGTVAVVPIDLALARSVIPSQYKILSGYLDLVPGFPADKYPLVVESVTDHDIRSNGTSIPDFQRVALSYPFIDFLGDGYSNFRYGKYIAVSDSPLAIAGSTLYGLVPIPSTFDPPCDGYAFAPGASGEIYSQAYQGLDQILGKQPIASTRFTPLSDSSTGPYTLQFYKNVTNQPSFSNGLLCDNFITLYNASVTQGEYAPVPVKGSITLATPLFPISTTFADVYGLKTDHAFIENNFQSCSSLRGYSGTGPGD